MRRYIAIRYIPKDSKEVRFDDVQAVVYLEANSCAIAYAGKANRHAWNYRFRNDEQRQSHIDRWVESLRTSKAHKEARRAEQKAFKHSYKVGDIFYNSWGYEQTNVDFYQVVAVTEKSVKVREIGQHAEETAFMSGRTTAKKDHFISEKVMTKKVCSDGSIPMRHGYCGPWDGQSKHYSCYA